MADAIGAVMKFGEPYRFMESRIVRVLKGFIRISVNLEEYRPIADEALYIGQNSVVEILEYSPDAVVDLLGFALANKSANIRNLYHLSKECNSWLEMYFQLLHTLSRSEAFDMRSIDYLLQSLHCHIVAYHQHTCCGASQTKGRKEELFRKFIELLNIHIGKHKLPFYAEKMNISPQYLSRLVEDSSGTAARDWINRAVVLQAKLLLRSSRYTIEQIAEELNFSTVPYFCRLFKREIGTTPTEYRNKG
ncbi:MAG: AraC family transcriptional regulator [Bacteroidaceae bacterium]|nr:AraC family transcriptional regulator [Bacteroidaceae bacterium]